MLHAAATDGPNFPISWDGAGKQPMYGSSNLFSSNSKSSIAFLSREPFLVLGNVTGYPGVFQSNLRLYPSKPAPVSMGAGFRGYG